MSNDILDNYYCEFVELYDIAGTKLYARLTSDHPDAFEFKKGHQKIVRIITPSDEEDFYVYDTNDPYEFIHVEQWIRLYTTTDEEAEVLCSHLLNN